MADNDTLDLLVTMVQQLDRRLSELDTKVDNMSARQVTRHEFDALTSRLDAFVLRGEFESYKQLNEQQRTSISAGINIRLDALEHKDRARGTLPNLWVSILSIAAVLGTIAEAAGQLMQAHH